MTLHFPESEAAPTTFAPPLFEATGENIVPVYARKPVRGANTKKKLLWAIPAVLALGIGAWALTAGEQSRDGTAAAESDTSGLITDRLSIDETLPAAAEPLAVSATPLVEEPAAAPAVVMRSAPKPAAKPAARSAARTGLRPGPTARAAPAPTVALPLPQETLTPVIVEPEVVAPPVMAPAPTLPVDPPAASPDGPGA